MSAGVKPTKGACQPTRNVARRVNTLPNPAIPMRIDTSPLGTLSTLPQEIRFEIFKASILEGDRILQHQYSPPPRSSRTKTLGTAHHVPGQLKWGAGDFGLLGTSKTIREEGLAVLRSQGIFSFQHRLASKVRRSDVLFWEHISNIRLELDLEDHNYNYTKAGYLLFFTGSQLLHNTCVVAFQHCVPEYDAFSLSPLYQMLSLLTYFKSVRLEFFSNPRLHEDLLEAEVVYEFDDPSERVKTRYFFSDEGRSTWYALILKLAGELGSFLGPARISEVNESDTVDHRLYIIDRTLTCSVTFSPYEYLSTKAGSQQ